jgi:short-subunit dehydrogenase
MSTTTAERPLAIVTRASSGAGYELARCCAHDRFDLLIASDEPQIEAAANRLRCLGAQVEALQVDLGTAAGVDGLARAAAGRDVGALLAIVGQGHRRHFMTEDFSEVRHVLDTDIVGTLDLVHRIGGRMQARRHGRILVAGSIAGIVLGPYPAVCSGTKAFIDTFSLALRNELADSGVTVTCLVPGADDAYLFPHAGNDAFARLARTGFEAMMNGEGDVIAELKSRQQSAEAT